MYTHLSTHTLVYKHTLIQTQGKQMPAILNAAGVKASCLGVCVYVEGQLCAYL